MNIIEMAEKAGMARRPADHQCRAPYWDVVIDSELEHFADLVLEEAEKTVDRSSVCFTADQVQIKQLAKNAIRALKGEKE